jgi:hypothetical protein
MSRSQRISNAKLRATGWAPRWRSAREGLRAAFAPTEDRFAAAELRASPGR